MKVSEFLKQAVMKTADTNSPVTMKDLKVSLSAHNAKKEDAGANDAYNRSKGLGTWNGRALVKRVVSDKYGISNPMGKITLQDAVKWAKSLTHGDLKPWFQEIVSELKNL